MCACHEVFHGDLIGTCARQVGTITDAKPVTARPTAQTQQSAQTASSAAEARGEGRHRLAVPAPSYTLRLDPRQVEPGQSLLTVALQRPGGIPEGDGRVLPAGGDGEATGADAVAAEPAGLAAASSGAQLVGRAVRSVPQQRPKELVAGAQCNGYDDRTLLSSVRSCCGTSFSSAVPGNPVISDRPLQLSASWFFAVTVISVYRMSPSSYPHHAHTVITFAHVQHQKISAVTQGGCR